ncbi:MAG: DEAD/DEAH box helicase, partial [Deltaproteobacteria bacterium]|nr:DEAD/DEAH box helicase [Deltaproteobacteria bacterium]
MVEYKYEYHLEMQCPEGYTEDSVTDIAIQAGFNINQRFELPGRDAIYQPVPPKLHNELRDLIVSTYPNGLYTHQSKAIEVAMGGEDVCLATSTASGKSLVFMAIATDMIIRNKSTKILALYPARALMQDQMEKWLSFLKPFDIKLGYIDGGVSIDKRPQILDVNNVVLMTPDVAHAWLMSHLGLKEVKEFMANIELLILDEAHSYEGVFGTNMAYFLRRFQVASMPERIITSTATLDKPDEFVNKLTGRKAQIFGPDDDCSKIPSKTILLAQEIAGNSFESTVSLLKELAKFQSGKFLAFADTRRMVERLVMPIRRAQGADKDEDVFFKSDDLEAGIQDMRKDKVGSKIGPSILPYRAGYEAQDRNEIQKALGKGQLSGVISTSAMELGIDIGEMDLIVLLNKPPSLKAFWQRLGRGGRKRPGICFFIDNRGTITGDPNGLHKYMETQIEPNWLYLENRYIQYTNALCAALEFGELGQTPSKISTLESLPLSFKDFLENEMNPTDVIPHDLYTLKQRAQAGPHREFPIRSGIEKNFQVKDRYGLQLGTLTLPQVLREAYPGAIYYYMGRPYRVYRFNYRSGEIHVYREKYWTTRPLAQTMVFPRFQGGILNLLRSDDCFIAEAEMQVSQRVTGFTNQRGSIKEEHLYGPSSQFYQRELNRFFETTGVCWFFTENYLNSEAMAHRILEAFCAKFGVQERDLGTGTFYSNISPIGTEKCKGACIFDATHGSLRLTERLAE